MSELILNAIRDEAKKLITRHQRYAFHLHEETQRLVRRSGINWPKTVYAPTYWRDDDGFNPYHVWKHAKSIAYAVEKSLKTRRYLPRPAVRYEVPKPDGTTREVSVFQVADQAIAGIVFKRLLRKNKGRFSSRSFAYRNDLSVHDAVIHIASSFAGHNRIFIAEYDFRKYFDSISHEHIEKVLHDERFYITDEERNILRGFVKCSSHPTGSYSSVHAQPRVRGIPQGVSTSLFLANLAAHPIDRRLENLRVDFARYADDTIVWSDDYAELCRAVEVLTTAAHEMGVEVNLKKSPGVRLLSEEGAASELSSANHVEFVGYRVDGRTLGIRKSSVTNIKGHISKLIYVNLLAQPHSGRCVADRVSGALDKDYKVMISQIRRYMYGDLTEEKLAKYLSGDTPEMRYQGLMSFYPIVDDEEQLRQLDGWLVRTIHTSLQQRASLFQAAGVPATALPHGNSMEYLISSTIGKYRVPSFRKIAKVLRREALKYGPNAVGQIGGPSSS
ncbi:hypothetical protein F0U60_37505 [Archangium minus]|uniref:Reverse transcriptase domain-containing protein n=1 Tax=Archangium minus TaxID=83450 RepID=A0ABY9X1A8_9BACT|nr:hypothetical protein F0U60_37505 [Archangium minus]